MKKNILNGLLIAATIVFALSCKKTDTPTPQVTNNYYNDSVKIVGKWQVISNNDTANSYLNKQLKYIEFTNNLVYYNLYKDDIYGYQRMDSVLPFVTAHQLQITTGGGTLIKSYVISHDTLRLQNGQTGGVTFAVRSSSVPSIATWAPRLKLGASILIPSYQYGNNGDIAYDGSYLLYISSSSSYYNNYYIFRLNTATQKVQDSVLISGLSNNESISGSVGYANGITWISTNTNSSGTGSAFLHQVNMANGSVTGNAMLLSTNGNSYIQLYGLAPDGQNVWCTAQNSSTNTGFYKYSASANTFARYNIGSSLSRSSSLEYSGGFLYILESIYGSNGNYVSYIHKCTTAPFKVVASYSCPISNASGLAYDGSNFWLSSYNTFYKVSLN